MIEFKNIPMETTPIEVLEHHVEMLEMNLQTTRIDNYFMRNLLFRQIREFEKAIIELQNKKVKR